MNEDINIIQQIGSFTMQCKRSQGKSDTALRPELPSTAKVIYRVAEVNQVKKLV